MPRTKRFYIAGVAQLVTQRGTARQACFFRAADYSRYLQELHDAALKYQCLVHAYVLMTNHVHLLVTPQTEGALAHVMQALGRRYVRYINDTSGRTGTLWDGRYKAGLIDSERYVMACQRYVELNPVRARLVEAPDQYPWSSFAANACGTPDPVVTPHDVYLQLAPSEEKRRARYRAYMRQPVAEEELRAIRIHLQRQRALGSPDFQERIATQLKRQVGIGHPGRPRKRPAI